MSERDDLPDWPQENADLSAWPDERDITLRELRDEIRALPAPTVKIAAPDLTPILSAVRAVRIPDAVDIEPLRRDISDVKQAVQEGFVMLDGTLKELFSELGKVLAA